jgi:hypothetical protein|tara:strand:+ start:8019 stop:8168 length:150 start_codon:yes stop_codon:yes gene_type:complete
MNKFCDIWEEFWIDETDYYGDLKACVLYLTCCVCQVILVVGVYYWMDKL